MVGTCSKYDIIIFAAAVLHVAVEVKWFCRLYLRVEEYVRTGRDKMEVTISKTKLGESKSRDGVKCLLYEARTDASHDFPAEIQLNKALQQINPDMGLAIMARNDSTGNSFVDFDNCPFTVKGS